MLPCAHQEPSSSSRTPQHSCPLHMSTLHVCIHASTHRVRAWPCTKPRPSAAARPARGGKSRAGCGRACVRAHTRAHGTASGTTDLPVCEKPGMMLTVSVTCITCATRMPAPPCTLGGQTGPAGKIAAHGVRTRPRSLVLLRRCHRAPQRAPCGHLRRSTLGREEGVSASTKQTQTYNTTCIYRWLSPRRI